MKSRKTNAIENLFFNNKFLMVFSLVMAIVLWTVVKLNYNEKSTRVFTDLKVSLNFSQAEDRDFFPFYDEDDLRVTVEVSGRSYNINAYSLQRDDITVEANAGYVDSAGYKTILPSVSIENKKVDIVRITPQSFEVYFDQKVTETFNVEARLLNKAAELENEGYIVGQPVPSLSTVDVTGPAKVLDKIEKVYFDAKLNKKQLPLTSTTELDAVISYDLQDERTAKYLVCENIGKGGNNATVTVPVNRVITVEPVVKFVNQPAYLDEHPPKVTITPAQVKLSYNADEGTEAPASLNIGTVDFRTLSNTVNRLTMKADEKNVQLIDGVNEFSVRIDLSDFSSELIDATKSNVVFLNQQENFKYTADLENIGLDKVKVIGPAPSLKKLQPEDLQLEINVSSLSRPSANAHALDITNISIQSKSINDCWISGEYRARVQMIAK